MSAIVSRCVDKANWRPSAPKGFSKPHPSPWEAAVHLFLTLLRGPTGIFPCVLCFPRSDARCRSSSWRNAGMRQQKLVDHFTRPSWFGLCVSLGICGCVGTLCLELLSHCSIAKLSYDKPNEKQSEMPHLEKLSIKTVISGHDGNQF